MVESCYLSKICKMILLAELFTHQNSSSYFKYQHPPHYHPNISLNPIVTMLRKMSGILITVRIDLTRFNTCDLAEGCSPKPWMFWFAPQPIFTKNRSSCRIHTAFKHNNVASTKLHNVNAILTHRLDCNALDIKDVRC